MKHALIIEDNSRIANTLELELLPLGFRSFARVWSEKEAVAAAARRKPDLVIFGQSLASGVPLRAARRIWETHGVPVIMVADRSRDRPIVFPGNVSATGPYGIDHIDEAVEEAEEMTMERIAA